MNFIVGYTQEELDDLDEAIQDAISDDEGRLSPRTLLHHLHKRGWTVLTMPPDTGDTLVEFQEEVKQ
jgi:hypothetical protein